VKRTLLLILIGVGLLAAADQTFTGVITDTMCGKSHQMMGIQPDEKCVSICLKSSAEYALYDGKTVYKLSDQKTPARFAAKRVKVSGSWNEKTQTIQVVSIEANSGH
jgi:hypothetical protein